MSEQNKLYLPSPGTPVRLALRWNDVESEYTFLQMTEEGIIVTPLSKDKKETTQHKKIFYPWRVLDYFTWFTDGKEVRDNE